MACLIITKGEQEGKHYQLAKRTVACGRDPAREIQITDPKVSRKHFLIRQDDDRHVVLETNAKNGISVNGQRCEEAVLEDGDEIGVGDTILTYFLADDPDRTDAIRQYRAGDRQFREDQTLSK